MREISLYWYRTELNFGDAFSPMAVRHCLGCAVRHGAKRTADMVAVGSVLDFTLLRDVPANPLAAAGRLARAACARVFHRPLVVWGSGMLYSLDRDTREIPIRRPLFLALRGALTRREMIACGLLAEKDDLALGDPGVFMAETLGIRPKPRFERGVVLHASAWANGTAQRLAAEQPRLRLIDPRRTPEDVVDEIASCREVFSSSLHGIVAADALEVPNRWIALETRFRDARANRFKFDDYYSAYGLRREPCALADVATEKPLDPVGAEALADVRRNLADAAQRAKQALNLS